MCGALPCKVFFSMLSELSLLLERKSGQTALLKTIGKIKTA